MVLGILLVVLAFIISATAAAIHYDKESAHYAIDQAVAWVTFLVGLGLVFWKAGWI